MEKDKLNVKNVAKRFASETPVFWKKVRNLMVTLGVIGGAIVSVPASVVVLPAAVITAGGYLVAAGIVGAALAQTTKK